VIRTPFGAKIKSKLFFQKPQVAKATEQFDDIIQQLREEKRVPARGLSRWLYGLGSFLKVFAQTCHPLLFLLFIMGLARRKAPPRWAETEGFLLSIVCLYALVLYWLSILSYITRRYFVFFVALCLIWSGRGLRELHQWLLQRVSPEKLAKIHITGTRGMAILTVMTVAIILPMSIHPQRAEKQGEKEAGLWIKNHSISSPSVYTDMVRINYYAGGTLVFLKDERILYNEIMETARGEGANFLVISEEGIESICPGFFKSRRPEDLEEVFRTNKGGRKTIIVYRVQRR